jgi:hypothetical protein
LQLVLALNRVLFDLINVRTKQLTFDKELRQRIFEYHLVRRSAGKQFKSVLNGGGSLHPPAIEFDKVTILNGPGTYVEGATDYLFP